MCAGVSSQGARFLAKGREFAKSFYCKNFAVGWARFLGVKSTHSSNLDQKRDVINRRFPKVEIDIGDLHRIKKGYYGFLVAVDIFNSFTYTYALKRKDREGVEEALEKLIDESKDDFGDGFEVITADSEFKHYKDFLFNKGIRLQIKGTGQHPALAEVAFTS